ncbi:Putative peptidoglycan binding domain-containing protein [Streptomyces sp. cf386]|uniref:peptidoglycan-binding domain-containing protein n=1 Tax=Streptomyces sp. cf386 TaxID=1761904 RepID=UPI0008829FA5|nr:peptidoglycan-binding domain-containing protein [Streptomyces sp. cf386]SDN52917.1 Putative peptidoglycan binding domain-containing protein [Streptomyces sp. cf386]
MSEPNGPVCPECGTPRASDGTPDCSCGRLASDTRRESRTAEAAAAEDFDPVRIRPFVDLGGDADADPDDVAWEPRELTTSDDARPTSGDPTEEPSDRAPLRDADALEGPRSRRRTLLITAAGATLVVLLTGAFLGGLFSYDSPSREGAASDDIRAPVPDGSSADGTSPEGQSSGTSSASPSRSSTPSPGATPADSSPTPTDASATPTTAPSGPGTTPSVTAPEPTDAEGRPPVLRFGDQGPEVVELQLRLRQIGFYGGAADGDYDREVESAVRTYQLARVVLADESGVYGTATRTSLESETSQP